MPKKKTQTDYKYQRTIKLRVEDIKVHERVRQQAHDLESLKESISRHGLLQPVLVDEDNNLLAGFRRLQAVKYLGWNFINAIVIPAETDAQRLRVELEENRTRKDFTTEELAAGEKKLHQLEHPPVWQLILQWLKQFWRQILELFKNDKK